MLNLLNLRSGCCIQRSFERDTFEEDIDAEDANMLDTCAICMEEIETEHATSVGCTHMFHGKCLVQHMISQDVRCPLCRFDPHREEEDEEYNNRVTLKDAMDLAKADTQSTSTKRKLANMKKWGSTKNKHDKTISELNKKLGPHEKDMENKVNLYEKKLQAAFEYRFAKDVMVQKNAMRERKKAASMHYKMKKDIVRQYGFTGFVPRTNRRRHRRR